MFDGGDQTAIDSAIGNTDKYNALILSLEENTIILEITTEKISKVLREDNFPFDKNIAYKALLLESYIKLKFE